MKRKAYMTMLSLENLIIDINGYNEDDSPEGLILRTAFNVYVGIDSYVEFCKRDADEYSTKSVFLITDNLEAKSKALMYGIGFSVYDGIYTDMSCFKDALYSIERIADMEDDTINRMHEREAGIPWTILETDRCIVREITIDDIGGLYQIYSDPVTKLYIEDLYEDYDKEVQFTKDYIANQYRFYEYGLWIVINKDNGSIIGRAGIFDRDKQDETEIGFVFDRKYWGQGYATEVLGAIMNYAATEVGVTSLVANVIDANAKSKSLLEKLGFVPNGKTSIDGKEYVTYINYDLTGCNHQ